MVGSAVCRPLMMDPAKQYDTSKTNKQQIPYRTGVSLPLRHTVHKELGIRTLAKLPLAAPGLARPVGIIHRRAKRLTPTAARFIDLLREAAARDSRDDVPGAARGAGAGSG